MELTPQLVLGAYAKGYFPMASSRDDPELRWYSPDPRGILPLEAFHVPRSLKKILRQQLFSVTANEAFASVIRACAAEGGKRPDTWINGVIIELYEALHAAGFASSVETWREGRLVGGLYGVSLGGAFFGESMFSHESEASKVALVHLVASLKQQGYTLLDTQYLNDHLRQFGAIEIPRADYMTKLESALNVAPSASSRLSVNADLSAWI